MKKIIYTLVSGFFMAFTLSSATMAATGTVSSSSDIPQYESQWGTSGSGNGQLAAPFDLSGDGNGHIYVLDTGNFRVQEFTTSGTYITQWGSQGSNPGQFQGPPEGIAVGSNGNVYVGDNSQGIEEFTSNGTFVSEFSTGLSSPLAIASNRNGDIYVADYSNGIVELTNSGSSVRQWGSYGTGAQQFQDPFGITVAPNGNVYVADSYNTRIQEYTSTGTFVMQWGTSGSGNGQFNFPNSITSDNSGNIYVTDFYNRRVQKFTSTGTYIDQWGTQGTGNGQFESIRGIYDDMNDNNQIYVVDESNGNVQKFGYANNLATVVSSNGTAQIQASSPLTTNFTNITSETAPTTTNGYTYPLGLINFSLTTTPGATVPITITYQTTLTPNTVVAQKYNTNTDTYQTIPNATITSTTYNGSPALQLTYTITDGGPLDEDGIVNGIIVDPVGIAITPVSTVTSLTKPLTPDTGFGSSHNGNGFLTLLVIISATTLSLGTSLSVQYHKNPKNNTIDQD